MEVQLCRSCLGDEVEIVTTLFLSSALHQTEAEKEAAAAADLFLPAPSPATTSGPGKTHSSQQYAKFATETDEWEARNKTRMASLYKALENKNKLRIGTSKK